MKTLLKLLIAITLLLNTCFLFSQDIFLKSTLDGDMLLNGPGHSYEETSSFNYELALGFEFENDRVLIGFEDHEVIDYRKWFMEYDKKLSTGRFNFYAGLEIGGIWRTYYEPLFNYPNIIASDTVHSFIVGANFETQIRILDWLYWTANINVFTSENSDNDKAIQDFLRWDVMSGLVIKTKI